MFLLNDCNLYEAKEFKEQQFRTLEECIFTGLTKTINTQDLFICKKAEVQV